MPTQYYNCKKCASKDIVRFFKTHAEKQEALTNEDEATKCPNCGEIATPSLTAPNINMKGDLQLVTERDANGNISKTVG